MEAELMRKAARAAKPEAMLKSTEASTMELGRVKRRRRKPKKTKERAGRKPAGKKNSDCQERTDRTRNTGVKERQAWKTEQASETGQTGLKMRKAWKMERARETGRMRD